MKDFPRPRRVLRRYSDRRGISSRPIEDGSTKHVAAERAEFAGGLSFASRTVPSRAAAAGRMHKKDPRWRFRGPARESSRGPTVHQSAWRIPGCLLGGLSLVGAGAAENAGQRVVALMAGVLEQRPLDRDHRRFDGPRPCEGRRIVDRELVVEWSLSMRVNRSTILILPPKPQAAPRSSTLSLKLVVSIDQRVALEVAARVAQPLPDASLKCGRPSSGMMRTSWIISTRIAT